jgi:hypothetical protein
MANTMLEIDGGPGAAPTDAPAIATAEANDAGAGPAGTGTGAAPGDTLPFAVEVYGGPVTSSDPAPVVSVHIAYDPVLLTYSLVETLPTSALRVSIVQVAAGEWRPVLDSLDPALTLTLHDGQLSVAEPL